MYKWHLHSSIGRGRPLSNDFARVADGIAASLRQFSISAQQCADEQGSQPPSRSERSARAIEEVSSLSPASQPQPPKPRGIDARSLAARPPGQTFTITRVDSRSDARLSQTPLSYAPRGGAGRVGFSRDGPSRGGAAGRGGNGRGGGAGRGRGGLRGRNARGPRQKKQKHAEEIDFEVPPYDEVEAVTVNEIAGGVPAPYEPMTTLESLKGWGPGVITSPQGIQESVNRSLAIGMDKKYPGFNNKSWHKQKLGQVGYTLLRDEAERETLKESLNSHVSTSNHVSEQRKAMEKNWVAGHYEKPNGGLDRKDVMGLVAAYSRKNSGFLTEESKTLGVKVAKLIPESYQKSRGIVQKSTA